MNMRTHWAGLLLAAATLPASAKTILLDVRHGSSGDAPESTAASFASYDFNVAPSATVEVVTTWGELGAATLTDEDGATYTVTTEGSGTRGPAVSGSAAWNDMEPILETYFYTSNATAPLTVTITGVEQFPAGEVITLTVFGIGDNAGQGSTFAPTYAGNTLAEKTTTQGTDQGIETDSSRSAQWQVVSDGTTTSISFTWDRNVNRYAALNGFSITSANPSFGDINSLTLTPETVTALVGGPDTQLTAIGNFSNNGDVDVTSIDTTYVSSDTEVITVSELGLVSIVGPGSATVTATGNGSNDTQAQDVSTFNIETPTSLTIYATDTILLQNGFTTDLDVTATSESLTDVSVEGYAGLLYSSSDSDIALVDPDTGVVTPQDSAGIATITASLAGAEGTQEITVEAPTSIIATVPSDTLYLGGRGVTISVTASSASLTDIPINDLGDQGILFFDSDDYDVAFVDEFGDVTPSDFAGDASILVSFPPAADEFVPITVLEASPKPATLLHRYSFTGTPDASAPAATVIPDSVGSKDATVVGMSGVFDATGTSLVLPGGANTGADLVNIPAYVDFPNYIVSSIPSVDTSGLSFETWMTVDAAVNWVRVFDFGNSTSGEEDNPSNTQTSTLDLAARRSGSGNLWTEFTLSRGAFGTQPLEASAAITISDRPGGVLVPAHVVVTLDPETGSRKVYLDSIEVGSDVLDIDNSAVSEIDDINCWLARSNASGDQLLQGSFDEFRIYSGIMTGEEVIQSFNNGPDADFGGMSYDDWAALYAGGEGSELDYDKDGMQNGVEFFMGETDDPIFTPNPPIIDGKITWPKSAAFVGSYTVETSPDLQTWSPASSTVVGATVEYLVTGDPNERFIRLNVTP